MEAVATQQTAIKPGVSRGRALLTMLGAVCAGCLTQALFWGTTIGAGWLVLDVLLVLAMLLVFGRDARTGGIRITLAEALCAGGALALGTALVSYAGAWTLAVAFPANVALLAALPFLLAHRIGLRDLSLFPHALLDGARRTPETLVDVAKLPRHVLDTAGRGHAQGLLRGLLFGLPITGIFAVLLSADSNFSIALARIARQSGSMLQFMALSILSAVGYLFWYTLHTGRRESATNAGKAPPCPPYRSPGDEKDPSLATAAPSGSLVRPLTWGVILIQLVIVFGLFVAVNAKYLFAGHALARAHGTVTYAQYLHAGFAQLVAAAVLAVVTVAVGHRLVRVRGAADATKAPSSGRAGTWLGAIETMLLALTCVTLLSCWQRVRIYEVAYGYTYLRLALGFFLLGVLAVLLLTVVSSLARAWRGWGASVVLSGIAIVVAAGWTNADLYIARGNVERAAASRAGVADPFAWKELDVDYLAGLSTDARPVLAHPFLQNDQETAGALRAAWDRRKDAQREGGWRAFRGIADR